MDLNIDFNDYYFVLILDSFIILILILNVVFIVNLVEVLWVGFYDFFILFKGNRFIVFRYFVVIVKIYFL